LGPILERLADEPDSGYLLAKLNTEENQRIAAQYNIRSIPAIKVFRNGQVVGEFTGGMPEANIRKFMQQIKDAPAPKPRIKLPKKAEDRLKQASQHLKKGRGFEAFVMLNDFPAGNSAAKATKLLPLAQFLCDIEDGDWVSATLELDTQFDEAASAWGQGDPETAVGTLLNILQDSNAPEAQTRAVLEGMFTLLGKGHPLVKAHKEKLTVH
jgi:putative thioredoxin